MKRPVYVKHAFAKDDYLYVVDGAGQMWVADVFSEEARYRKKDWNKVALPEVDDADRT